MNMDQERRVRELVATSGHFCGDFLEKRGQEKRVRKLVASSETLLWRFLGKKGLDR